MSESHSAPSSRSSAAAEADRERRELTGARYGALGLIDRLGTGLEQFITIGIDADAERRSATFRAAAAFSGSSSATRALAAERPRRRSALGRLPAGPSADGSFLGVPILLRGTAFGNLYLTEKREAGPSARRTRSWCGCSRRRRQSRSRTLACTSRLSAGRAQLESLNELSAALVSEVVSAAPLDVAASRLREMLAASSVSDPAAVARRGASNRGGGGEEPTAVIGLTSHPRAFEDELRARSAGGANGRLDPRRPRDRPGDGAADGQGHPGSTCRSWCVARRSASSSSQDKRAPIRASPTMTCGSPRIRAPCRDRRSTSRPRRPRRRSSSLVVGAGARAAAARPRAARRDRPGAHSICSGSGARGGEGAGRSLMGATGAASTSCARRSRTCASSPSSSVRRRSMTSGSARRSTPHGVLSRRDGIAIELQSSPPAGLALARGRRRRYRIVQEAPHEQHRSSTPGRVGEHRRRPQGRCGLGRRRGRRRRLRSRAVQGEEALGLDRHARTGGAVGRPLDVESGPGRGTTIVAELPLDD